MEETYQCFSCKQDSAAPLATLLIMIQSADMFSNPSTSVILMIITLFVVLFSIIKRCLQSSKWNLPPGRHGWPLIGETLEFLNARMEGSPHRFIKERVEKYKSDVFRTCLNGQSVAVLYGPAGNKFLFKNENKLVTVWWPPSVQNILGECISNTGGIQGIHMRKMVSYFLTPDAFTKLYIKKMDIVARHHINTHWEGKEGIKAFPTIRQYTFEVAGRLFMSLEDPTEIAKLGELFNVFIKGIILIPFNFPGTRYYNAKRAAAEIRKELLAIIKQRRVDVECKTALPSQDLLSHLLANPDESGKFMSEAVIVNNIILLLFAGHDTSSSAMTMLVKYLAENPRLYDRVLAEQNEVALSKQPGEYLQWEDLQKMKYSWNVASEVMRLSAPLTGAFREALVDIKYEGYDIPKGWKLYWSSSWTHRDPSFFEEPAKFEPSRFEGSGPAAYSYVPFGGGPRMCLGKEFARLEILIFLHNVVRRFGWSLVNPGEKIGYDPVPAPATGLPVRLHPHPHPVCI